MILVGWNTSFTDCYVQRVFIQMGLLKAIKYLMFDGSALNGIVAEKIEAEICESAEEYLK